MNIDVGRKPVAGSPGLVTSVTPVPLFGMSQFDPVRLLLDAPKDILKLSVILRLNSALKPVSSVFWRSALMPETALVGVNAPRSMAS